MSGASGSVPRFAGLPEDACAASLHPEAGPDPAANIASRARNAALCEAVQALSRVCQP